MDPTWERILHVIPPKSDKRKWSLYPAQLIQHSFDLSVFSKKMAREVMKYFRESIQVQKREIAFKKAWSPKIYHKNTYWSLELENRSMETILRRLSKAISR